MTRQRISLAVGNLIPLLLAFLITPTGLQSLHAQTAPTPAAQDVDQPKVVDVVVEGNQRVNANRVLAQMKLRPGSAYSPQESNEDWKRIFALREFENIVIRPEPVEGGIRLRVQVTELPLLAALDFVGAKAVKTDRLRDLTGLKEGAALDRYRAESAIAAIEEEYRGKGYSFVSVTLDRDLLAKDRIARYTVSEGPKVKVRSIRFTGNASVPDAELQKQIETSKGFWFFTPGKFSQATLDSDTARLSAYYVSKGFLNVKVGRDFRFNDKNDRVDVTYLVEEGPRFRVASIAVLKTQALSAGYFAENFRLKPDQYYTADALDADARFVSDSYGRIGHIHARVETNVQFAAEPGKVDVVFTVDEGSKVKVGEILISGNKITQDKVVLRELHLAPQDVLDATELRRAKDRLIQTQLFTPGVDIHTVPTDDPAVENIVVNLEEARTAMFLLGAGVSSNSGLIGNVSLIQRNADITRWPRGKDDAGAFKGAGQTLRLVLEPGTQYQQYTVGFTEPYFMDRPIRFDASLSYFTQGWDSYDQTQWGPQVSFGKDIARDLYASVSLRAEAIDIANIDHDAPPDVRDVRGSSGLTSVTLGLVRDKTDNIFIPTTGYRLSASVEQAGALGGDYTFTKFVFDAKRYWTVTEDVLGRRSVFSLKGRAGYAAGDPPIFERFYAGGQGSIRGFEYRGAGPHYGDDPIGGDFLLLLGSEYEFPLVGQNLRGVVFLDSGTVEKNVRVGQMRAAAGVGLRFTVPMLGMPVPFALDFAAPLAKQGDDDTQVFSFNIAWSF